MIKIEVAIKLIQYWYSLTVNCKLRYIHLLTLTLRLSLDHSALQGYAGGLVRLSSSGKLPYNVK